MNDMSATIIAKSDQWNASDIVGQHIIGVIREVRIKADKGDDQPVDILFEGEKKAFRPCKGVRRLLVRAWGPDANEYIGKALEMFCDSSVTWAGKEEGGIRVSRMSHINAPFTFAMRTSRQATKPYQIKPLKMEQRQDEPAPRQQARPTAKQWTDAHLDAIDICATEDQLDELISNNADDLARLQSAKADLHDEVTRAYEVRRAALTATGRSPEDFGEDFTSASGGEG